jgi:hypothetical protein
MRKEKVEMKQKRNEKIEMRKGRKDFRDVATFFFSPSSFLFYLTLP